MQTTCGTTSRGVSVQMAACVSCCGSRHPNHIASGKLAGCNEQLLLLKLQAANALHLFSIRSGLDSTGP